MKLVATAMVRNEADIVEAFVRHNLTVVDAIHVLDHGSQDRTPEILAALVAEGLPLHVTLSDELAYRQAEQTTALVRGALSKSGADVCFVLDGDEFLRIPSRPAFEAAAHENADVHLCMMWLTYVPDFSREDEGTLALLRSARRPALERHGLFKVAARRHMLQTAEATVAEGNHKILRPGTAEAENPHALLPGQVASIAHVPVRSTSQFISKISVGWLSHLLGGGEHPMRAFHWREQFDALMAGRRPTHAELTAIAASWSVQAGDRPKPETIEWLDDPFLADIELRYTPDRPAPPLGTVLGFAERVAELVAKTSGGL